eukprot:TRINITY_DN77302_c0_g1_i1.p2 TRINITY_DN77302_c0_g1~~TRINITY_DN77302_c0_g1_i1.p2  ORF type:complete len:193 (-),score=14.13 TRINITY_DN77302_c0_g1_i1:146-652(-)
MVHDLGIGPRKMDYSHLPPGGCKNTSRGGPQLRAPAKPYRMSNVLHKAMEAAMRSQSRREQQVVSSQSRAPSRSKALPDRSEHIKSNEVPDIYAARPGRGASCARIRYTAELLSPVPVVQDFKEAPTPPPTGPQPAGRFVREQRLDLFVGSKEAAKPQLCSNGPPAAV